MFTVCEHSLMVELHYVIVQGTGSSPAVLVYSNFRRSVTGRSFRSKYGLVIYYNQAGVVDIIFIK